MPLMYAQSDTPSVLFEALLIFLSFPFLPFLALVFLSILLTPPHTIQQVVCVVSLVGQWVDEACSKSNGSLKILQYHGQTRQR